MLNERQIKQGWRYRESVMTSSYQSGLPSAIAKQYRAAGYNVKTEKIKMWDGHPAVAVYLKDNKGQGGWFGESRRHRDAAIRSRKRKINKAVAGMENKISKIFTCGILQHPSLA